MYGFKKNTIVYYGFRFSFTFTISMQLYALDFTEKKYKIIKP